MELQELEMNKSAILYNESINSNLRDLALPFLSSLGIDYFCYNRFIPGRQYLAIGTANPVFRNLYEGNFDRYLFFDNEEELKRNEWQIIWDLVPKNNLLSYVESFGFRHGLTVFRRRKNYIEAWTFATSKENSNINLMYINDFPLLDRFIYYFGQKARTLISTDDKGRLAIFKNHYEFRIPNRNVNHQLNVINTQKNLTLKKYPLFTGEKTASLSPREMQCLFYLTQGKTSKEIAQSLEVSHRTIEAYIDSIKNKTDITEKSKLIQCFHENDIAGWFEGEF